MKKRRKWPIVLAIIIIVIAAAGGGVYAYFNQLYSKTNYIRDDQVTINREAATESAIELESTTEISYQTVSQISSSQKTGTYSVMLIGTDTRQDELGNSDAMILMTINDNIKTVFFVSFMRDLYSVIPDIGVRKLNNAYAIGGGPLLLTTLQSTYGVDVEKYICVNFDTMSQIIDAVGGIDMTLNHDEIVTANDYITSMAEELEYDPEDYYLEVYDEETTFHLNGVQAVAYSRIRYVGNADYERTQRQRTVLIKVLNAMADMSFTEISDVVTELLPALTHNLTQKDILSLLSMATKFADYDIVTDRIPYDGMYTSDNEILVPDMEETIQKLHGMIYATDTDEVINGSE